MLLPLVLLPCCGWQGGELLDRITQKVGEEEEEMVVMVMVVPGVSEVLTWRLLMCLSVPCAAAVGVHGERGPRAVRAPDADRGLPARPGHRAQGHQGQWILSRARGQSGPHREASASAAA